MLKKDWKIEIKGYEKQIEEERRSQQYRRRKNDRELKSEVGASQDMCRVLERECGDLEERSRRKNERERTLRKGT